MRIRSSWQIGTLSWHHFVSFAAVLSFWTKTLNFERKEKRTHLCILRGYALLSCWRGCQHSCRASGPVGQAEHISSLVKDSKVFIRQQSGKGHVSHPCTIFVNIVGKTRSSRFRPARTLSDEHIFEPLVQENEVDLKIPPKIHAGKQDEVVDIEFFEQCIAWTAPKIEKRGWKLLEMIKGSFPHLTNEEKLSLKEFACSSCYCKTTVWTDGRSKTFVFVIMSTLGTLWCLKMEFWWACFVNAVPSKWSRPPRWFHVRFRFWFVNFQGRAHVCRGNWSNGATRASKYCW